MVWLTGATCWAAARAAELSLRTFSASAALIGAATFAFTSDIAARSGSGSTASSSSSRAVSVSVLVMVVISSFLLGTPGGLADALVDRGELLGDGHGRRVVAGHVERQRGVDRRGDVRVDQRHRGAVGQRLDGHALQLEGGELVGGGEGLHGGHDGWAPLGGWWARCPGRSGSAAGPAR